jgi:DNA-binding FrmR family transcriptional regulator
LKCQRNLKTKDQERSGKTLPQVDIKLVIPYTLGYMVKQKLHKHGEVNNKSVKLVNMASGSLSKVSTMILEKRYCPEVIQQIDSVIGLLKSTRSELLKGHLESCLADRLKNDKEGAVKELLKIYNIK